MQSLHHSHVTRVLIITAIVCFWVLPAAGESDPAIYETLACREEFAGAFKTVEQAGETIDWELYGYRIEYVSTSCGVRVAVDVAVLVAVAVAVVIAEILEPLYRNQGDFQKLIGVHEVQVRRAEDQHRKVELLHQVAELHEDAGGDVNGCSIEVDG